MKVHLLPSPDAIEFNNGIGRVVHAQYKHLPEFGVEFTTADQADVIAAHTQQYNLPRVDVLHLHGLYWTGDIGSGVYQSWHIHANQVIVESMRRAKLLTVPSEWVGMPIRRDMRIRPAVIGHGIEISEWNPGTPKTYALWNKNRAGDVCDPRWPYMLAEHGVPVISTFSPAGLPSLSNLQVTGQLPAPEMKSFIQDAGVYLATTKETFGIGTLEAMACGVPVLGFDFGGHADFVEHKVSGYLARPYNLDDLIEGYHYIQAHRASMSEAARAVAERFDWSSAMLKYVHVYEQAMGMTEQGVSIVITNYNYAQYVTQAVESVLNQTIPVEVIVVDDGSTDHSMEILKPYADRVRLIATENRGVAAARNAGIEAATGSFIVCLDADDRLAPQFAQVCSEELQSDRGLGIVYTGLGLINESNGLQPNTWPPEFNWEGMAYAGNPPPSCIPSGSMFRKSMWARVGGYRQVYAPAEDTEFWVRGLASGFTARKITDEFLFHYRPHSGSASRTKPYRPIALWHPWLNDRQYPLAVPSAKPIPIRSYSEPLVSVIIPVAPSHLSVVSQAIESLLGQTFRNWEVIVVVDAEDADVSALETLYPFIRVLYGSGKGPGAARNIGMDAAKAPLCFFLDADDFIHPNTLHRVLETYKSNEGRYVYTDWVRVGGDRETCQDFSEAILKHPLHGVNVLIATQAARKIRFDERLKLLEDWDFSIRCYTSGMPGVRLAEPLIYVNSAYSTRTPKLKKSNTIVQSIQKRYQGERPMPGCCGGDNQAAVEAVRRANLMYGGGEAVSNIPVISSQGLVVRMVFTGTNRGAVTFGGRGITPSGAAYRGGDNPFDKYADVDRSDVGWMQATGQWVPVEGLGKMNYDQVDAAMSGIVAPTTTTPTVNVEAVQLTLDGVVEPVAALPVESVPEEPQKVITPKKKK